MSETIILSTGLELTVDKKQCAEIHAPVIRQDASLLRQYCVDHALFQHQEACEFIFYIPAGKEFLHFKKQAVNNNCPSELLELFELVRWDCRYLVLYA